MKRAPLAVAAIAAVAIATAGVATVGVVALTGGEGTPPAKAPSSAPQDVSGPSDPPDLERQVKMQAEQRKAALDELDAATKRKAEDLQKDADAAR